MATNKHLGRVAIKVMGNKYSQEGIDSVTLRELDILSGLDHGNIIKCLDFEYKYKRREIGFLV